MRVQFGIKLKLHSTWRKAGLKPGAGQAAGKEGICLEELGCARTWVGMVRKAFWTGTE